MTSQIRIGDYVRLLYDCAEPGDGPYDCMTVVGLRGDICIVEDAYMLQMHLRVIRTGKQVSNVTWGTVQPLTPLELLAMAADDPNET